ncbi:MAG: hypothetical protein NDJ89_00985 [Oligoflexia bacterium]|nr:hypothetical protein [Oligoflexia bacterium]
MNRFRIRRCLPAIALATLALGMPERAFADRIVRSRSEAISLLGVTNGTTLAMANLYTACAFVAANEYVDARFQAELTNNLPGTVGLGRAIFRNDTGLAVTRPVMDNITRDMHHKVIVGSGIDDRVAVDGTYCYALKVWAVSSYSGVYGGNLNVEKGYGELILIVRQK